MHVEEDGTEWWSAREMAEELRYSDWRNMENVIRKARSSCRNAGQQVADHFVDTTKMMALGKGSYRPVPDVHMTRFGCYLLAMCGDPDKFEVAAAQQYFAVQTRVAELNAAEQPSSPAIPRPWSERFKETIRPHMRFVYENYPGCFTVVTTLVGQMLSLEDELIRHMLKPSASDRPDISIGLCWGNHRRDLGLAPVERLAPLWLPDQAREAELRVYDDSERGAFEIWFSQVYLREKLPNYLVDKKEFNRYGELPPASAADNTCRQLTGQSAILRPPLRKQLTAAGGFFKVGDQPPALESPQRTLFDKFS